MNILDNSGSSPLLLASSKGYTEIVDLLIKKGADVNIKAIATSTDSSDASTIPEADTPLSLALDNNHLHIAKFLIENGAVVDISIKVQEM